MTRRSLGNYRVQEVCPQGPAWGNSRAGENVGNNKKDRVRPPALGVWGMRHGGWRSLFYSYSVFSHFKNTEKGKIKSKNHPPSHHLMLCLPTPLPRGDHYHRRLWFIPFWTWPASAFTHTHTQFSWMESSFTYGPATSFCHLMMHHRHICRSFIFMPCSCLSSTRAEFKQCYYSFKKYTTWYWKVKVWSNWNSCEEVGDRYQLV